MSGTSKASEKTERGSSEEERAAIKERAAELQAEARSGAGSQKAAADEAALLSKIAQMAEPDRELAQRLHAIVTAAAPELSPKLWYGQPAYAEAGKGRVLLPQRAGGQGALLDVRVQHGGEPRR